MNTAWIGQFGLFALGATLYAGEPPDTNYDESKVPPYTLPDPLVCFDGRPVRDAQMWREARRPEILSAFATNVYGHTPAVPTRLQFETTDTDPHALGGIALRKEVTIRLFPETNAPWIDLLLLIPNDAAKPMPVFLGLSYGNQGVHADPGIRPSRDTTPKRGEHASRWPLELILKRGYAVATFAGADVEQDRHGSGSLQKPDGWADPRGEFLAAFHAEPVYRLLGVPGLGAREMPPANQSVGQTIGYHLRTGDHDITAYDWQQYLNFADRHLRASR